MDRTGFYPSLLCTCALVLAGCSESPATGAGLVADLTSSTAAASALSAATPAAPVHPGRNYDRRALGARRAERKPQTAQLRALEALRASAGDLAVRFDPTTGVTRSLSRPAGHLTEPDRSRSPREVALAFVRRNAALLGLTPADLAYEITDVVYSAPTGATHVYLSQVLHGVPVYNGQLQVHVNRDGRVFGVTNAFFPGLAAAVRGLVPRVTASAAVAAAAANAGSPVAQPPAELSSGSGPRHETKVDARGISRRPIDARLALLPVSADEVRLVWQLALYTLDGRNAYDMTVDAIDGAVWTRVDWVTNAAYRVYPVPVESPNHTEPLPPADGRVLVSDPADAVASPYGWHDLDGTAGAEVTGLGGNNVHAYEDANNDDAPPMGEPSCGDSLVCDFPLDLGAWPSEYVPAAVTNLFYWTNTVHDVQYRYGFDEQAGNFQVNDYGRGGLGSDALDAEAQDGSAIDNANFMTPPDGTSPRMQMFLWDTVTPSRDGDLDSGIVVHEYGHGISIRQVGGPSNVDCLWNEQQPGEGWSDWLSLVYTAQPGDQGSDARGMGTYALGEPTDGPGIRTQRYSTDPAINTLTYESIRDAIPPHGVGEAWAQALWEVYWKLVDAHGFSPDLHDPTGGAGNQRAMLYVNEGFKLTACEPTFLDARDAVVQAAIDNWGGEDVCRIWEAFAAFGLGTDATTDGSNASATNGFEIPLECQCQPPPIAKAGPDHAICLGSSVTLGEDASPENTYEWSPGGETTPQITVAPTQSTTYTVTATTTCGSRSDSATVTVDDGTLPIGLTDDFELSATAWTMTGLWHQVSDSTCAPPGYSSPTTAMYYGLDSTCSYDTGARTSGDLISPVIYGVTAASSLSFDYFRITEGGTFFDRTEVAVSTNDGASWTRIWFAGSPGVVDGVWASSGMIPLGQFAARPLRIRFHFDSVDDFFNGFVGWLVDDVVLIGKSPCDTSNTAPSVGVVSPVDGTLVTSPVTLQANAWDMEDGEVGGSIVWTSSVDGTIGFGPSLSTVLSPGTHVITASATDSAGLTGSSSVTVTVVIDTVPPQVSLVSPPDGSGWGGDVYLEAEATDDLAVYEVDYYVDDVWVAASWYPPYSAFWDSTTAPAGWHVVTAHAMDTSGNVGVSMPASIYTMGSNTPPTATITYPLPGQLVSGIVDVTVTATDAEGWVPEVDLYLDGSYIASDYAEPWSLAWNTSGLSGEHVLTALAWDDQGYGAWSQDVWVTVQSDPVPPEVSILQPVDGSVVKGEVSVEVSASDDTGVAMVELYAGTSLVGTADAPPYSFIWSSEDVANGPILLRAEAYDHSGNVAVASVSVVVENAGQAAYDPDFSTPACLEPGASCKTGPLVDGRATLGPEPDQPNTIGGACADGAFGIYHFDESLDAVRVWSADGEPMRAGNVVNVGATVWVWSATADYLDVFRAADAANPKWELVTTLQAAGAGQQKLTTSFVLSTPELQAVRVQWRYYGSPTPCGPGGFDDRDDLVFAVLRDEVPPEITITAPSAGETLSGDAVVSVNATDNEAVALVELYADDLLVDVASAAPYTLAWDTLTVEDGAHTLFARAYDATGNVGVSQAVAVAVDNQPPAVAITSPTEGAVVGEVISVVVSASDLVGITLVELRDGETLLGTATAAPYLFRWNANAAPEGVHVLTATAYDVAGRASVATVGVVVDNTAPSVVITSPRYGAKVKGVVSVEATASDDRAVTGVELAVGRKVFATDASAPYAASLDTRTLPNGDYELLVRAYDVAGNMGSATVMVTVHN